MIFFMFTLSLPKQVILLSLWTFETNMDMEQASSDSQNELKFFNLKALCCILEQDNISSAY